MPTRETNHQERKSGATQQTTEGINKLRCSITKDTEELATQAPNLQGKVEQLGTVLLTEVTKFEDSIEKESRQKLSPERLYEIISPDIDEPHTLKIVKILNEYKEYLQSALENFGDEATRENKMVLFRTIVYEFDYIEDVNTNFRDAITAFKLALFSVKTEPFTREQIVAINIVMDLIKKNIYMHGDILGEIFDKLDSHFNLAHPLKDVTLIE